jgi:hypothetical protein
MSPFKEQLLIKVCGQPFLFSVSKMTCDEYDFVKFDFSQTISVNTSKFDG